MSSPAPFPLTPEVIRLIGGGYLRNTIREPRATCVVCTTPVDGYNRCYKCNRYPGDAGGARLAAQVFPLVYAVDGAQSAHLMRAYKHPQMTTPTLRAQVAFLIALALQEHRPCMEGSAVDRQPFSAWTTVPSTRNRLGEHPLVEATRSGGFAPGWHFNLVPGPQHGAPAHQLAVQRWVVDTPGLVQGRHVLVVDDTWTSGANGQSAAAAINAAGAEAVTVLAVARWLNVNQYSEGFIKARLAGPAAADYSPLICPVTGGACPPRA